MKEILILFFGLAVLSSFGQDYAFVNGDPKFMTKNQSRGSNPNADEYVLQPGLPDGSYTIYYDKEKSRVFQKGFLQNGHRIKYWAYYTPEQKPKMEIEYDENG